jgi:putative Mn2+ efflux pump MntP
MTYWEIILIAVGLAMDCFAVSLCLGTSGRAADRRPIFRIVFHFGLFQGLMTFLGWLAGTTIMLLISGFDHWLVFALLAFVGVRMIIESFEKDKEDESCVDSTRGFTLVVLALATSLDALAIGISMALLDVKIVNAALTIGVVSSIFSLVGLLGGDYMGKKFGKRMELVGGVILIFIGVRVLLTHLGLLG